MRESKQTIAKLLVAFADALNSMDDRQFDLLIQGKAKLRLVEEQKTGKMKLDTLHLNHTVSELAQKLNDAETRETAESLIASINQPRRREFLVLLAKACGVRVQSKDNISTIERKLIENTVGSRLRSEAIKNVAF
jgi:hypothetical protein